MGCASKSDPWKECRVRAEGSKVLKEKREKGKMACGSLGSQGGVIWVENRRRVGGLYRVSDKSEKARRLRRACRRASKTSAAGFK